VVRRLSAACCWHLHVSDTQNSRCYKLTASMRFAIFRCRLRFTHSTVCSLSLDAFVMGYTIVMQRSLCPGWIPGPGMSAMLGHSHVCRTIFAAG
jgi:hypothetical protein